MSSKSREWPSAPLSSAATAGVQVLLSPNTVDSPLPSERQRFQHLEQRRRWIPRRAAPGSCCRGNPASAPWRAPAPPAGYRRISGRRHRLRALRFRWPSCFLVLPGRVGGPDLTVSSRLPAAGISHARRRSSTGTVCRSRNAAHDGLRKTHASDRSTAARRNWRWRSGSRSPRSRPTRSPRRCI